MKVVLGIWSWLLVMGLNKKGSRGHAKKIDSYFFFFLLMLNQFFGQCRERLRKTFHSLSCRIKVNSTYIYIYIYISSSSCRATSTDILDLLSPLLPIVHRLWRYATSRILTELLYICSSWSSCFCLAICWGPQEYITYELVFQAAVVSILLYGCTTWTLTKRLWKKARRQLHKNAVSNIEQVLEATLHKAPTIRPSTFHHENYPS